MAIASTVTGLLRPVDVWLIGIIVRQDTLYLIYSSPSYYLDGSIFAKKSSVHRIDGNFDGIEVFLGKIEFLGLRPMLVVCFQVESDPTKGARNKAIPDG